MAHYKEARYKEIKDEMTSTLIKVGWPKAFVETSVPFLPISGWMGDNLIKRSENMTWWNGCEIVLPNKSKITIFTLKEALEQMVMIPERSSAAIMRTPISGIYKIKGILFSLFSIFDIQTSIHFSFSFFCAFLTFL